MGDLTITGGNGMSSPPMQVTTNGNGIIQYPDHSRSMSVPVLEPTVQSRLKPRNFLELLPDEVNRIETLAKWMVNSKQLKYKGDLYDEKKQMTQFDLCLIMIKGIEIGMPPLTAVESIDLIMGKPTLDGAGMIALTQASGLLENFRIDIETADESKITVKRVGQDSYTRSFTLEEAKRIMTYEGQNAVPLADKKSWKAQGSRVMLKWRNVSAIFRLIFGDVIGGMYTGEELDQTGSVTVDENGRTMIIEQVTRPSQPAPAPTPKPIISVADSPLNLPNDIAGNGSEPTTGNNTIIEGDFSPAPEQPPAEPKWYNNAENIDLLLKGFKKNGMTDADIETIVGKNNSGSLNWARFEAEGDKTAGKVAFNYVNAEYTKTQKPAQPKNGKPATAQKPAEPQTYPVTDEYRNDAMTFARDNFDITDMTGIVDVLGKPLNQINGINAFQTALVEAIEAKGLPFVTWGLSYHKGDKKSYIKFATESGFDAIWFAGRNELATALTPLFDDVFTVSLTELENGEEVQLPKPIRVIWTKAKSGGGRTASSFEPSLVAQADSEIPF